VLIEGRFEMAQAENHVKLEGGVKMKRLYNSENGSHEDLL